MYPYDIHYYTNKWQAPEYGSGSMFGVPRPPEAIPGRNGDKKHFDIAARVRAHVFILAPKYILGQVRSCNLLGRRAGQGSNKRLIQAEICLYIPLPQGAKRPGGAAEGGARGIFRTSFKKNQPRGTWGGGLTELSFVFCQCRDSTWTTR